MTAGPSGDLNAEVIRVLTAAARRTCVDGSPRDFAEFLADVVAATAANVGGPERLLAGRPGSWEASLVRSLVEGTLGEDLSDLLRVRTEPIVVRLNVAEILEGLDLHSGLLTVDEAVDACEVRFRDEGLRVDDDPELEDAIAVIEDRYAREFAAYAERFAAAVRAAAAEIGGATLRTLVEADTDPRSDWWTEEARVNVSASIDEDDLAHDLWQAAHDVVALPNVDIDLRTPHGSVSGDGPGSPGRAE